MSKLLVNALTELSYPLCATNFRRTRAHLLAWNAVLPASVKETSVRVSRQQSEVPVSPHSGSWLFIYENLPQLRYHNPHVKFLFEAHQEENSTLSFVTGEGEETCLTTTGLRQQAIQSLVDSFIEEHCHANLTDHDNQLRIEQ